MPELRHIYVMSPPPVRTLVRLMLFVWMVQTVTWLEAATVALSPVADTTLSQTSPDNNFGREAFLSSGVTVDALINRALLKFDVAANVPSNATIERVVLTLTVPNSTDQVAASFSLHRVLRDWGERSKSDGGNGAAATSGEATWLARLYPANQWSVAGAGAPDDFIAAASATQLIGTEGNYSFTNL